MTYDTVKTAIFPVAGMGTRFLPATKAMPKELLPVIDTPLIQYAIDEARNAGVERLIFVNHPSKEAIERHVMDDVELRAELRARGKGKAAAMLKDASLHEERDDVVFVMQEEALGLGHAILCARDHVLPGPVAILLPDDLILGEPGCLSQMIDMYSKCASGHMVASMEVEQEETAAYGILDGTLGADNLIHAVGMVEKPDPKDAPSRSAVVGRYILDASIFDDLTEVEPGAGNEIQLTDAIAKGIGRVGLSGYRFDGVRFDCGSKAGMLRATLHLAAQSPEYRAVLDEFNLSESITPAA